MNCEKVMNRFLKLDNSKSTPLVIFVHMMFCKKCRTEIFEMQKNFAVFNESSAFTVPLDMSDAIIERIANVEIEYIQQVSNMRWIVTGLVIFFSIILMAFSEWADWLNLYFGSGFDISFSIVMGLAITIYAALYIAAHIDQFKKISARIAHR